jgi:peptide chain release factor 3
MENEYNEKVNLERMSYTVLRWLGSDVRPAIPVKTAFDDKERPVVLFKNDWELNYALQKTPDLVLLETPKRNPITAS